MWATSEADGATIAPMKQRSLSHVLACFALIASTVSADPAKADTAMKRFTIPNVDANAGSAAVRCRSVDGKIESTLYRVDALGKPGVPALAAPERSALQTILAATHYRDLRFAYVGPTHRFVLFRSTGIVCRRELMAYEVLNGRCDEFWSPSDEADKIVRAPSCSGPNRPWQLDIPN